MGIFREVNVDREKRIPPIRSLSPSVVDRRGHRRDLPPTATLIAQQEDRQHRNFARNGGARIQPPPTAPFAVETVSGGIGPCPKPPPRCSIKSAERQRRSR